MGVQYICIMCRQYRFTVQRMQYMHVVYMHYVQAVQVCRSAALYERTTHMTVSL